LVPAWMVDPAAASLKIVDVPCLSVAGLLDLRAFLDSVLACGCGKEIAEGDADGKSGNEDTTRSVRGAADVHADQAGAVEEGSRAAPNASAGGIHAGGRAARGRA